MDAGQTGADYSRQHRISTTTNVFRNCIQHFPSGFRQGMVFLTGLRIIAMSGGERYVRSRPIVVDFGGAF